MKAGPIFQVGELANVLRGLVEETPLEKPVSVVVEDGKVRIEEEADRGE